MLSREIDHIQYLSGNPPSRPDSPGGRVPTVWGCDSGIHPLADILGVRRSTPSPEVSRLTMTASPLLGENPQTLLPAMVGVDLCGSGAVRTGIDPADRIATTALGAFLSRGIRPGSLELRASLQHHGDADARGRRSFSATVEIADSAGPVGAGTVAGVTISGRDLSRSPNGRPAAERVAADLESLHGAPAGGIARALLLRGRQVRAGFEGRFGTELRPLLANRVGDLQGGAAPAIADLLARDLIGQAQAWPRAVFWSFRGPTRERPRFRLELARGRDSVHAMVRMSEGDRLRGIGVLDYGLGVN